MVLYWLKLKIQGAIFEKRVTDLTLSEFLAYGPQREPEKAGKSLLRKTKDGKIVSWNVETDDSSCTLQEAFQKVDPRLGFNIELKFDDNVVYKQDDLIHALQSILQVNSIKHLKYLSFKKMIEICVFYNVLFIV